MVWLELYRCLLAQSERVFIYIRTLGHYGETSTQKQQYFATGRIDSEKFVHKSIQVVMFEKYVWPSGRMFPMMICYTLSDDCSLSTIRLMQF